MPEHYCIMQSAGRFALLTACVSYYMGYLVPRGMQSARIHGQSGSQRCVTPACSATYELSMAGKVGTDVKAAHCTLWLIGHPSGCSAAVMRYDQHYRVSCINAWVSFTKQLTACHDIC
jgi:hypothetical protein